MTKQVSEIGSGRFVIRRENTHEARDDSSWTSVLSWPTHLPAVEPFAETTVALSLRDAASGEPLAVATVLLPGGGRWAEALGLEPAVVERAAFLSQLAVREGPDRRARVALALYAMGREARIRGLGACAAWLTDDAAAFSDVLGFRRLSERDGGATNGLGACELPRAMARFAGVAAAEGHPVESTVLVDEIRQTLELYLEEVRHTSWFRSVYDRRLTRAAYVNALGNLHQFVRYTTRLIGRCVAHAPDSQLRAHFARSLREELNHELIIEQDLAYLGEDVDYVVREMSPSVATRRFMATQESAIGFSQDPVLMLAAPLAAEGIAGSLDGVFMEALHDNVRRWGVENPARATLFFSSHIEYDGGTDGHFAASMSLLRKYVRDELRLQQFLGFLGAANESMLGSYEDWERDVRIFSAGDR